MTDMLTRRGNVDPKSQTQGELTLYDNEGRDRSHARTSQGTPGTAMFLGEEAREKTRVGISQQSAGSP